MELINNEGKKIFDINIDNLPLPLLGKEGIYILPLPRGDTEGLFFSFVIVN